MHQKVAHFNLGFALPPSGSSLSTFALVLVLVAFGVKASFGFSSKSSLSILTLTLVLVLVSFGVKASFGFPSDFELLVAPRL